MVVAINSSENRNVGVQQVVERLLSDHGRNRTRVCPGRDHKEEFPRTRLAPVEWREWRWLRRAPSCRCDWSANRTSPPIPPVRVLLPCVRFECVVRGFSAESAWHQRSIWVPSVLPKVRHWSRISKDSIWRDINLGIGGILQEINFVKALRFFSWLGTRQS